LNGESHQGIRAYSIYNRGLIEFEEENIKNALRARDNFQYLPQAMTRHISQKIDLKFDPFIMQADQDLEKGYQRYV